MSVYQRDRDQPLGKITLPLLALKGASRIVKERKNAARGDETSRRRDLRHVDTLTIRPLDTNRQRLVIDFLGKSARRQFVILATKPFPSVKQRLTIAHGVSQAVPRIMSGRRFAVNKKRQLTPIFAGISLPIRTVYAAYLFQIGHARVTGIDWQLARHGGRM